MRVFATCQIAVVGSQTGQALSQYGLKPDLVPPDFRAESLAESLIPQANKKRVLSIRASRGRDVLYQALNSAGVEIHEIVAYQNRDVSSVDPQIIDQMSAGQIDWTTVTSSAIANSLAKIFGDALKQTQLASLSPITSQKIRELGFEVACEAKTYTMESLVEAILKTREC